MNLFENIITKIGGFFATPNQKKVNKGKSSGYRFYKTELANNETIFAAITLKANAIASAPIGIYKDHKKLTPNEHPLARLFKYGPNPRQSMFGFIQYMEMTRNTSEGAYAIIEYDRMGDVQAIWALKSDLVEPIINTDDNDLWYRIKDHDTDVVNFVHNSHIIALNYLNNNGLAGINPLNVLKNTISYDKEVKEFSINQMKNSLKANAVVTIPGTLDAELIEQYDEMMEDMQEAGIIYVDDGKDFKELSNRSYIDSKVFEVENITVQRVERVFNIVGKLIRDNSTKGDTEDLIFLKDTLLPIIREYESEFNRKLLNSIEIEQECEIKFNLNGFARATMEKRGNFYQIMFRNNLMTTNEIRALEDLPPVEGGDRRFLSRDLWDADNYDEFMSSQSSNQNNSNE